MSPAIGKAMKFRTHAHMNYFVLLYNLTHLWNVQDKHSIWTKFCGFILHFFTIELNWYWTAQRTTINLVSKLHKNQSRNKKIWLDEVYDNNNIINVVNKVFVLLISMINNQSNWHATSNYL